MLSHFLDEQSGIRILRHVRCHVAKLSSTLSNSCGASLLGRDYVNHQRISCAFMSEVSFCKLNTTHQKSFLFLSHDAHFRCIFVLPIRNCSRAEGMFDAHVVMTKASTVRVDFHGLAYLERVPAHYRWSVVSIPLISRLPKRSLWSTVVLIENNCIHFTKFLRDKHLALSVLILRFSPHHFSFSIFPSYQFPPPPAYRGAREPGKAMRHRLVLCISIT